ncbi:uncharacterized protein LOC129578313 isoform X2 [Sitodiplosis mosellana]|nr:uncharacterized protein LOC129578313 isoform X2 [Sitodiplosis mosellana]XP_055322650.1 uncharacterized protein LOC129578313 isoform X2 [Sitodiplosis mosellana]XP_055322660.1 uncharacterized protein LOC129578313 isoform X2 [Sitodiplosis mosellana]XP_055322670.1 uncharacterized protein LOC129578313 isoform X2 [Sitodiplosis mosellana]
MEEGSVVPMDYWPFQDVTFGNAIPNKKRRKMESDSDCEDENPNEVIKIIHLNDDCLEPIFLKLTKEDLANIAESNLRFLKMACYAFARNYAQNPFESGYDECDSSTFECSMNIIKHFGKLIQKLDLYDAHNDCQYNKSITDAIFETCDSNITDIVFDRVDQDTLNKIRRPFPNLTNLNIYDLSLPQKIAQLNRWFPNVTKLILRCSGLFSEEFCALRHLTDADIAMNVEHMQLFIRSNPQLTSLRMRVDNSQLIDGQLLNFMAHHLPDLEQLTITINNWKPVAYLSDANFRSLRMLSLSHCWDMLNDPNDNPTTIGISSPVLESTKIKGLYLNDACVEFASRCRNVTDLEFTVDDDMDTFLFIRLAQRCPKLNKLQMIFLHNGENYGIDPDGLIHLLGRCRELTTITLICVLRFIESYSEFCRAFAVAKTNHMIDPAWNLKQIVGPFKTIDIEISK